MENGVSLNQLVLGITRVDRIRVSNSKIYSTIISKSEWETQGEIAEKAGFAASTVKKVVDLLEEEGLLRTYHNSRGTYGRKRMIIVLQDYYTEIWREHDIINGLFRTNILQLKQNYPYSVVAYFIGYTGDSNERAKKMCDLLTELGWINTETDAPQPELIYG